jgi:type I restriction enzyme S subunit
MKHGLLGEFMTLKRGYDLPHRDRKAGDIPIISSSGPTGTHSVAKVDGPGVVTGRYGTLGEVFYTSGAYWPLNTALYVQDFKGNHPRFIYYFMHTLGLGQKNAAGAVPGVNRNVLHKMPVTVPGLDAQKRIASILSAYDDLIENNKRRMALLEESIHLLYREWFVYLRFPGHERAGAVDGVPQGWTTQPLGDVCDVTMGQSPKSEFYNEDGRGLPFHQGVKDYGDRFVSHRLYCTVDKRLAHPGDILFSVRAPVGRLNIAQDKLIIGRGLCAIRRRDGYQAFQFYQLKSHFHQEDMIGGGTIFASVSKKDLLGQEMLVPSPLLIHEFDEVASRADRQIHNLHEQNLRLREARDLLLPRLMDGRIPV